MQKLVDQIHNNLYVHKPYHLQWLGLRESHAPFWVCVCGVYGKRAHPRTILLQVLNICQRKLEQNFTLESK